MEAGRGVCEDGRMEAGRLVCEDGREDAGMCTYLFPVLRQLQLLLHLALLRGPICPTCMPTPTHTHTSETQQ